MACELSALDYTYYGLDYTYYGLDYTYYGLDYTYYGLRAERAGRDGVRLKVAQRLRRAKLDLVRG